MGDVWVSVSSHAAYASVRRNLADLLRGIPGASEFPVPACPGWNVRDLIAHLVNICRNAEARLEPGLAGRADLAPAGFTETGIDWLLREWERSGGVVESALARTEHAHRGAVLVMDAFTHELDARIALGAPLPSGHPAFRGSFEVVVGGLSASVMIWGLAPLLLETESGCWLVGDGEPATVVRGSAMELYRSMTGRRTYRQIAQVNWSTDPGPWLPAFRWGPFLPPDSPVE
jgi:uncharacterized protein (TIGR03083 family)